MLMGHGSDTGPVLDDVQMEPTPKGYVDLQGDNSEIGHDQSFIEQKTRVRA